MLVKVIAFCALAPIARAQSAVLSFTAVPNPVTDGQPQAILYQTNDTVAPVTITLRKGISTDLDTLYNLTTTAIGGQYIWTPRTDLPNGDDYALQITQGEQTNYYGPFRVQGYTGPLPSSAVGSSMASSSGVTSRVTASGVGYNSGGLGGTMGTMSMGTASPLPRNTTSSSATLSATITSTVTSATATTTTASATSTSSTGAADMLSFGASFALAGAFAALLGS